MSRLTRRGSAVASLCAALLAGCHGQINDGPGHVGGLGGGGAPPRPGPSSPGFPPGALGGAPGATGGAPGSTPAPTGCTPMAPPPPRILRLSNAQYANAVRDLLGLPSAPTVSGGGESA